MAPHLPVLGEYFVFTLNPAQTLNLILDDPEVAEACEALGTRCKKYIGCCIGWTGVPAVGTLFPFKMSMVSRGLAAHPNGFITEAMTLPILPTTYHPRGRKPLIVDPPLPWDDCYHCTIAEMVVRVLYRERDVRPRGKYALLPRQQTAILRSQQTDDDEWREKLFDMDETGGTDFEPDHMEDQEAIDAFYETLKTEPDMSLKTKGNNVEDVDDGPLNDVESFRESNRTCSDHEETDSVSRTSSCDSFEEKMAHQFDYSPAIDLTLDLETVPVDELANNVYDFYDALQELGEIIMAHQAKVETALAEVQRQDAEFDAKVVAAQRSCSMLDDSEAPYERNETDSADAQERLQNFVKAEESILRVPHRVAMESLEEKQPDAFPIPFDSQPEYGPVGNAVDVESIPNDNLSSQTLTASSPKETDVYPLKYPRSCWRVTQSMKRTCRKTIKATRKAGSICYSRCTSMLCFS